MNIVFIHTDQQRADSLGITGHPVAKTPNLDALGKRGMVFDRHFVANPVCSPSRASIWSGQYPSGHGLWSNGCAMPETVPTIPEKLSEAGWQTAHIGKFHLTPILNRVTPHPSYGFEHCVVAEGDQQYAPDDAYFNWLRQQEPLKFAEYLNEIYTKGQLPGYPSELPRHLHQSEWTIDCCENWLSCERDPERPFFLSVGLFDPHHAFNPLQEFWDLYEGVRFPEPLSDEAHWDLQPSQYQGRRNAVGKQLSQPEILHDIQRAYAAMVSHVDACVGRLMDALEQQGLIGDTLVVFTSDHGELLGDHNMLWKGPFLIDSLMRVPLLMAGPGIPEGQRTDRLTQSIDFFPSFCRLAGIDLVELSGHTLFTSEGAIDLPDEDRKVYAEWDDSGSGPTHCLRMLRSATEKIIVYIDTPEVGEYYDLVQDPDEKINLWDPLNPTHQSLRDVVINQWHRPRADTPCSPGW